MHELRSDEWLLLGCKEAPQGASLNKGWLSVPAGLTATNRALRAEIETPLSAPRPEADS